MKLFKRFVKALRTAIVSRRSQKRLGRTGPPSEILRGEKPSQSCSSRTAEPGDGGPAEQMQLRTAGPVAPPVVEAPFVPTLVNPAPLIETPLIETPVNQASSIETPVTEAPLSEVPSIETSVNQAPFVEESLIEAPLIEAPPSVPRLLIPSAQALIPAHEDDLERLSPGGLSPGGLSPGGLSPSGLQNSRRNSVASFKTGRSTDGDTLNARLRRERLVYHRHAHTYIIPDCKQKELITIPNIEQDIHEWDDTIPESKIKDVAPKAFAVAPKVFATLALMKKGPEICGLLADGISDADLPLTMRKGEFVLERRSGVLIETFERWSEDDIENFDRMQWWMLATVFKCKEHHDLDHRAILPFVDFETDGETEKKTEGGYSEVFARRIHPSHHDFWPSPESLEDEPLVAIKRLHSDDEIEFRKEEYILKALGSQGKKHPHLITLLATYKHHNKYHLMFPWANANLRKYWRDMPSPDFDSATVRWFLKQITGIADALNSIHNFTTTHPLAMDSPRKAGEHHPTMSRDGTTETLYGRHGDIKAENILWFSKIPECKDIRGALQIADFGLGSFHGRDSRSKINPDDVQSSPTYEPPECKLHKPVSQSYDIWSLGCLYLEFISWLLCGKAKINGFSSEDSFFTIINDGSDAVVRREVILWVENLHSHEKCSDLIHDLLNLIMQHVLMPNSKERISAEELWKKLEVLQERAMEDDVYLLCPSPLRQEPRSVSTAPDAPKKRSAPDVNALKDDTTGSSSMAQSKPSKDLVGRSVGTPAHPGHLRQSKTFGAFTSQGFKRLEFDGS